MPITNIFQRIIGKLAHISYCFVGSFYKSKGVVYMLHEISEHDGEFCISRKELEYFLRSVEKDKVINLSEWESKSDFIAITIDDVPENFYNNGFPLFKKYGIPFTIFVSTSLLDTPGFIKTEQLKEMAQCNLCTVGSHGTIHDLYRKLNKNDKIHFLEKSQKCLSEICNRPIDLFAFPYGSVYACGLKGKKLVSRFYKYGFGTIACDIISPISRKYFLPRKNLTRNLIANG